MKINSIIAQYDLQTYWFLNALESITEEESNISISENINPIKWVGGHLIDSRITINNIISNNVINVDYKKLFGKGTNNKIDDSFPAIEQIRTDWTSISEQLIRALKNIPDEILMSKPPFQTSIPDETLLGLIAYFSMHESFHIGQLSVYRKLIGKNQMKLVKS